VLRSRFFFPIIWSLHVERFWPVLFGNMNSIHLYYGLEPYWKWFVCHVFAILDIGNCYGLGNLQQDMGYCI
jgi:hypothetical protein